ncbi:MAG: ATP-binding protein, partial [Candidatus Falkowbacteria bacterium]|nr:ATP-binding protein [Candidatus Falkowbacteria bacterium]
AFLVLLKNKSSKLNRAFFWATLSASGWILTLYLFYFHHNEITLFLGRLNFAFSELVAFFVFLFGYWFPKQTFKINKKIMFISVAWVVFLVGITLFTDLIDKNEIVVQDGIDTTFGSLYFVFVLHFLFFVSLLIIFPLFKYKNLDVRSRYQVNYFLLGAFLTFIAAGTSNIFLPLFFKYYNAQHLGPLFTFFIVGSISYTIVRHRLMDIKLAMRQYLVLLLSFSVIVVPSAFVIKFYEQIVPQYKVSIDLTILFLAVYFFPLCKDYFYHFANKYLFSSLYDSAEVIAGLSDKLRSTLSLANLYGYVYESLNNALHLKAFGVLGYDEKADHYYIRYNHGFDTSSTMIFSSDEKLRQQYIRQNKPIVVNELKLDKYDAKAKRLIESFKKLKIEVVMPLNVKDKTIGLLALGEKESNDIYNDEDFQMLEVVSAQAAIAIENAMLYEEAKFFNIKLENEVKKATKDLRHANVKLKQLDASKSEFISIASHQLRTPLTVIKGYVSMILEGSFGKVVSPQRDSLDKVYQSNERLINLVENLLNVSRIESGRLQFKFDLLNLEDLVGSVVEELAGKARDKRVKLNYRWPDKSLPKITLDEEKIRQVILNLIDNAIKYTRKGTVTVSLKQVDENLEFAVADSGMGISPADMSNLFKKFYRGAGTSLVNTEGTGLGLYVAREMIEAHQGKIWAESKGEGKGSRFIFTLPIESPVAG